MSDSIKFGPEWLRNMSNDTGGLSSAATSSGAGGGGGGLSTYSNIHNARFPLAEYRYGREEMLSLYDKNFKLPELLPKFNKLFIEKMQCPLALLPPTADEETPRGLTPIGGLSSERNALGLSNSSSGTALGGISSTLGMSGRGMRGSSIDRGRGRTSRGGIYHPSLGSYQRSGFVYDEDSRGIGSRGERSWTERNGTETDWNTTANGSPSPRKDFSTLRSGGAGGGGGSGGESWRRSRVEDEGPLLNGTANEGWRTSSSSTNNTMYKWPVRSTSWRGGENEQGGGFNSETGGPPRLERSKSTQGSLPSRDDSSGHPGMNRRFGANASWDEDNLPEWAMDDPIEGGGSFDATGAFLDDRHMSEKSKASDTSSSSSSSNANSERNEHKTDAISDTKATDKDNPVKDNPENVRTNEKSELKSGSTDGKPPSEATQKDDNRAAKEKGLKSNEAIEKAINEERTALHKQQASSYKNNTSKYSGPEARDIASNITKTTTSSSSSLEKSNMITVPTPIDRLQEVAEDIEKLIMDDDQSCNESDEALLTSHLHARDSHKHPGADDVLAEKKKELDRWYYRDPQGKVQGPFTATEMLEWYRAGYFDETLNVRRVCDPQFIELGELLKACSGSIPFVSMPPPPTIIPPLLQSQANEINLNSVPSVKPATPTKPLANPLVHTNKMPPPTSANNPPYFDILHQTPNFLGLMNPPANDFLLSNSLPKHQNPAMQTLPNALSKQTHLKNQHQTQSLQHLLSQHKNDFNAPDQVDPMHHMLNSINHPQISPPVGILPQVPTIPPQTTSQNNSFQSLIMQLQMQKPHIMQQQIQQHHQQSLIMNAMNSPSLPLPHHSIDEMQHPPAGIWDLPIPPPAGVGAPPPVVPSSSMKTEMQIIEHLQAQAKAKEEQFKFEHLSAQQLDQWKKQQQALHQQQHQHQHQHQQQQQQQQQQPPPPQQPQQMQHHQDVQQIAPSPLVLGNTQADLLQQTDIFRAKNENVKELEANRAAVKQIKVKTEPPTGIKPPTIDSKLAQNINKINNNAIDIDELHIERTDGKLNKAKVAPVIANAMMKQVNETKANQKLNSGPNASDVANKSNNNVLNATAPKNLAKESTKKKSKEKDQKAVEEKRRQQEEEEERKRLELIAAQRKAKLVDQNAVRIEQPKRNNLAASVAPWSNISENASSQAATSSLTLAEIQKAERERRAELYRLEQAQQQNQAIIEQQQQKEVLKWKLKPQQNQAKSLAEIQAEESKARQTIQQITAANAAQQKQQSVKKDEKWSSVSQWSMIWGNEQANSGGPAASGNGNANCFWEEPVVKATTTITVTSTKGNVQQNGTSKPLAKSQTVSNMQSIANNSKANQNASKPTTISKTSSSGNVTAAANTTSNNNSKKAKGGNANSKKDGDDEFSGWCAKALAAHNDVIDVPTFVSFLRDIESPFEVKDYIRMYLGETKECGEFAKHFLERRSKYKNQQRAANAHIDDMCSPAPAITPAILGGGDGQEAKGKAKKEKKKSKMTKLDSRILGFSVTSAEDRLNVGARDYARDGP